LRSGRRNKSKFSMIMRKEIPINGRSAPGELPK
jgi:hypothetical protein